MGESTFASAGNGFKPEYHCASVSWGAGSLYMLLQMLEDPKQKLNKVIFVNMGKEFKGLLHMRDKVLPLLEERGISYTEIDISKQFEHDAYCREIYSRETGEIHRKGYGWCGGVCRWGTTIKLQALYQYYRRELTDKYHVIEYVGICAGEEHRVGRNFQNFTTKRYPLVEQGVTKKQALLGCYRRGFLWEEDVAPSVALSGYLQEKIYLYELLDNASCFWCRNKNLKELKNMYYLMPQYWEALRELQAAFPNDPMKGPGKSVFELEERFRREGRSLTLMDSIPLPSVIGVG